MKRKSKGITKSNTTRKKKQRNEKNKMRAQTKDFTRPKLRR